MNLVPKGLELHFAATIGQKKGMTDANKAAIYTAGEIMRVAAELNFDVVACMAGAETGVGLSDRISEKLGLRTNGGDGTEARRNKYLMCEKIRAHKNTRAVKQVSWAHTHTPLAQNVEGGVIRAANNPRVARKLRRPAQDALHLSSVA